MERGRGSEATSTQTQRPLLLLGVSGHRSAGDTLGKRQLCDRRWGQGWDCSHFLFARPPTGQLALLVEEAEDGAQQRQDQQAHGHGHDDHALALGLAQLFLCPTKTLGHPCPGCHVPLAAHPTRLVGGGLPGGSRGRMRVPRPAQLTRGGAVGSGVRPDGGGAEPSAGVGGCGRPRGTDGGWQRQVPRPAGAAPRGRPHPAPGGCGCCSCPGRWLPRTQRPSPPAAGSRGHSGGSGRAVGPGRVRWPGRKERRLSGEGAAGSGQREPGAGLLTLPPTLQEMAGRGCPDASQVRFSSAFSRTRTFLSFCAIHGGPAGQGRLLSSKSWRHPRGAASRPTSAQGPHRKPPR